MTLKKYCMPFYFILTIMYTSTAHSEIELTPFAGYRIGGDVTDEDTRPYLSFTLGAAYLDPEQGYDSSTEFSYSLGGGGCAGI
ncbi:MAG TPA: hypothetical protein ENI64_06920 [Gammaproteobacteria bacterium]|nr:hypothetical protein [Gammaproteobacteria bacterium]